MQAGLVLSNQKFSSEGYLSFFMTVLPVQPTPQNQLLIQERLYVPECYFGQNVGNRVLKFEAHFSQNAVFIGWKIFVSSFGYLFELMFES